MSILDDVFDYLKDAHRFDRYIASCCPFHDDSRPSFFVYEDKYRCASCGVWGDTDKLLDKLNGSPLRTQSKPKYFHNPWTQWIEKYGSIQKTLIHAHQYIMKNPSSYLTKRAIPPEYQQKAKLGYLDDFYLFPIKNQEGIVISGVARAGEENTLAKTSKYILPTGSESSVFYAPSWNIISRFDYVFLTFGIIDALSLAILGYPALSTTTGKNTTAGALDWCRKMIYIIPDKNEEPDALRLIGNLGWRGRLVKINWPQGIKDVNDAHIHYPTLLQSELSKYVSNMVRN